MATTAQSDNAVYIPAFEAERLVQDLKRFSLVDVGGAKWAKQHEAMEKLNIQAHKNTAAQSEEYVSEAILTFQMVDTIIHDLILIQTWKKQIYPQISDSVVKKNSLALYFILYHEATVVNLLQVLMYHPGACKEAGDAILDLINATAEKIVILVNWKHGSDDQPASVAALLNTSEETRFGESIRELEFAVAVNSLGIFRSITDSLKDLPLSALNNILLDRDVVSLLVLLMERAPWIRRRQELFEQFDLGSWKKIAEEDLVIVTKIEAQVWLALMNLLLEPVARKTYQYSKKNHSIVLRLKDCITDQTVDQLPPLVDIQRYLEELLLMTPPDSLPRSFGIQPISEINSSISDNVDLKDVAEKQKAALLSMSDSQMQGLAKSLASMYDLDNVQELLDDPKCGKCGQAASQRCSLCKQEWYCSRPCQVAAWKGHKVMCELLRK
ncbi:Zinc finger MYND domain-containing protein 10 [Kappamyces sp. JEL0829]|nr:Zinc finger MYND domain-containing protein 10 [Kappamyces sp. JEL0829]